MRKHEVDPCLIPYIKINSKLINDLNLRANIIRFLEENVRENFYGLGFGNGFLNITPNAQATQEKADEWDFMKTKHFFAPKISGHYQERNGGREEWGEIFANRISNKDLICQIH